MSSRLCGVTLFRISNVSQITLIYHTIFSRESWIQVRKHIRDICRVIVSRIGPTDLSNRNSYTLGSGAYLTSMAHSGPITPEPWPGKRLALFPEGGLKRTGVFSCSMQNAGKQEQAIGLKIGKQDAGNISISLHY